MVKTQKFILKNNTVVLHNKTNIDAKLSLSLFGTTTIQW